MMKLPPSPHKILLFLIGIFLAFSSVTCGFGASESQNVPPISDIELEVGSTNGIVVWAVLITILIVAPILWDWLQWKRKE